MTHTNPDTGQPCAKCGGHVNDLGFCVNSGCVQPVPELVVDRAKEIMPKDPVLAWLEELMPYRSREGIAARVLAKHRRAELARVGAGQQASHAEKRILALAAELEGES